MTPVAPPPSHILYADDIIVFCKGTRQNLELLMSLFKSNGQASGQLLSIDKCMFYSGQMSHVRISSLVSILGFCKGSLPFVYFGVPMFAGKPKRIHLEPIADHMS